MDPLLCTKCWSENKLDRSTWSIKSILGGSYHLNRIGPADVSLERMRTISRDEGWGHYMYSSELARTTGRLNVAAISVARSIPSRPSIKKMQACRIAISLKSHGMVEFDDHALIEEPTRTHEGL